jgi:prolyl oligopeptidase
MKKIIKILIFLTMIFHNISTINTHGQNKWNYPKIFIDTIIDSYFGNKVIDPFRNIENLDNLDITKWMKEQNIFCNKIISHIASRKKLMKEIVKLNKKQNKWTTFARPSGVRFFYLFGFSDDNIERLGYVDSLNQNVIEIFNTKEVNKVNKTNYIIDYYEPSFDGNFLTFGMSDKGSEKSTLYILNVVKKELLPEHLERMMGGNPQWLPDGSGFFYKQDKEILTKEDKNSIYEDSKVKLHILNNETDYDKEIFSRTLNTELNLNSIDMPMLFTFPSSDKVLINIQKGAELYYTIYYGILKDILNKQAKNIEWKKVCDTSEKIGSNVLFGNLFFGLSYKNNPNGQLIVMKLPDLNKKVLFEGINCTIEDMVLSKDGIYVSCIENGISKLIRVDLINFQPQNIELPYSGGIDLRPDFPVVSFYQHCNFVTFGFSSYNKQWDMYVCDSLKKIYKTNFAPEVSFYNPSLKLVVEEKLVSLYDSTLVPLSIVYKEGLKFDGSNPTIINAYGSYGLSIKPGFDRRCLAWFSNGGIYAVAHVRGGGEKGDKWYRGGYKATKSNSWRDLISCTEYLIKNKYTSPQKIALLSASAGGITVGMAIIERPDLFKAAVIYSGCLNALRMENFFNTMSVTEFGTTKDSIEFKYLYNMDVYQHIREGVTYPSILFTASLNDARVAPWEPAKAVARLQQVCNNDNIILFNIEDGGHFSYPSRTDVYSFLFWQLGHPDFKLKEKSCFYK